MGHTKKHSYHEGVKTALKNSSLLTSMNNFTYFGLILERRRIGRDDSNEILVDFQKESSNLFNVVQLNSSM